ncbi:hypothetical protein [Pricia sp.]|uniref:hypothetical protein n=1 Tax=Pricia sp. TaxID=2268138 RepID=UPI0035947640
MKNILTIPMTHSGSEKRTAVIEQHYHNLLTEFKKQQMGYATIAIIGQSCLGSIAAMMILMSNVSKIPLLTALFLVTILCMAFNGAVLAQLKSKTIFNLLIASVLFSFLMITVHLI